MLYENQSFSETSGFPDNQLTTEYWYPIYDNISVDSQLLISNAGCSPTTITIYGGNNAQIDSYDLATGASTRINYAGIDEGLLHVVSSASNILSTQRLLYNNTAMSSRCAVISANTKAELR